LTASPVSSGDADTSGTTGSASSDPRRSPRQLPWWVAPIVVITVVVLDQLSKAWAVAALVEGVPQPVIGEVLQWRLSYNTGSAFSLFQGFTPLLAVLAGVIAVVLIRVVMATRDALLVIALSLVLGGAIGNLIDRVTRADGFLDGGVVDFISVPRWPTFNIADSAITIGALLLVWWAWRRPADDHADDAADNDAANASSVDTGTDDASTEAPPAE